MRIPLGAIILGSIVVVGGCSNNKGLIQLYSSGRGPEEFSVMPVKPLTDYLLAGGDDGVSAPPLRNRCDSE